MIDEPSHGLAPADEESASSGSAPQATPSRRTFTLRKRSEVEGEGRFRIRYGDLLNAAQLAAVEKVDGAVLVVAGAGTGKTRTLVYRVARMLELGIPPQQILLLTFTRRAAQQMLRRAGELVGERAERVEGGTFHAFANTTLRRYAPVLGYDSNFTILDQADSEDVVNLLRARIGLDARGTRFPRKQTIASMISASINKLTPIEQIIDEHYPQYRQQTDELEGLARSYQEYKRTHNLMDYDDLLVNMSVLLDGHNDIRDRLADQLRYIMVDEYQDTNRLQHEIVRLLGSQRGNVMAVGDDSQSIYSFRGANFRNIMDFPRTFPNTEVITLEENYRSTQPILDLTNEILKGAIEKYEKNLYTRRGGGDMPMVISTADEQLQSQFVVQRILDLREEGIDLNEIAVLFRASYHSFDLEIELNRANIPYVKMGGFKFIETAHVKDLISYLRVVHNPRDVVSWNRILLLLPGVGPRTAQRIVDEIAGDRLKLVSGADAQARSVGNDAVGELFATLTSLSAEKLAIHEKVDRLVEYYRPILKGKYDDYSKRTKDVEMFSEIAGRYRSLGSFLSDMALEPPSESVVGMDASSREDEKLILSTIHSAKGLEWNTVFVIWALEGRFPSMRSAGDLDDMEEERRLMYVATTRAKDRLVISYPTNIYDRESGSVLSKPSRFIEGIPEDIAERWVVSDE